MRIRRLNLNAAAWEEVDDFTADEGYASDSIQIVTSTGEAFMLTDRGNGIELHMTRPARISLHSSNSFIVECDMSDQCPTCGVSPSSRLALMRSHMNLQRVIREFDEQHDQADALLRASLPLLRDAYANLGLIADLEVFLAVAVPPKERE